MQKEVVIDLLRKNDPHALRPVSGGRCLYNISKRTLDFSLALLMLIILSPLMALAAILIKLDSPGPIFFKQDRVGVKRRRYDHINLLAENHFLLLQVPYDGVRC